MPGKSAADWRTTIDRLAAEIDTAEAELAELRNAKRADVLAAAEGDAAARRRLSATNTAIGAATARLDDLRLALEQAERGLAGAIAAEAETGHRERLAEVRRLARERVEVGRRLQAAIDGLTAPLAELNDVSSRLAGLIVDQSEAGNVDRWRNAVRDALAVTLSQFTIDDLGMPGDRRPLPSALAIGAVDWPDEIIERLAERAAHGEAIELAA